ncbi:MAG: indolepyruvate oxidoreductase subunit beta family protein [bacterium]
MTKLDDLDDLPQVPVKGVIKLAILAVGGQGGGVLTSWIEALARANGYAAQATSVAGVAQRTGATIYYIEMAPNTEVPPVFALMPAAGDVDVMITAEMMEAGRAIIRGFVTPDRTTLITSTHRALAVSEKMVPGDGIADSAEVLAAAEIAAHNLIHADFDAIAVKSGSVISASLFGALAASATLPFPVAAYEAAIKAGGKGAEASLRAFTAGFEAVIRPRTDTSTSLVVTVSGPSGPAELLQKWQRLLARAEALPPQVAALARPGLQKVVDFQDLAYGADYLGRVEAMLALDTEAQDYALTRETAKYVANAMAYDDVIRVADLKTRASRQVRIAREMGMADDKVMYLTEFFHPKAEEIIGMLPADFGARVATNPRWTAVISRLFGKGRRLRSDGLLAYGMLYVLGGLKSRRRKSLRHKQELAHLEAWLATARAYQPARYELAVEVIRCRRLIKGYSDTHSRGLSKFDRVLGGIAMVATRDDAADWARRLREAALKDEEGVALDGALKTISSFV